MLRVMEDNDTGMTTPASTDETAANSGQIAAQSTNWAMLTHLSAFAMFLGIPAVVGPAVLWAVKKQDDAYVDFHGKEAVNFNLSFLIYGIVSAASLLLFVGLILLPAVLLTWFVLVIVASAKASGGEYYRYPLTIRFVK